MYTVINIVIWAQEYFGQINLLCNMYTCSMRSYYLHMCEGSIDMNVMVILLILDLGLNMICCHQGSLVSGKIIVIQY